MTTEATPGWVRDAVFYQIFPDRFASSLRVPKPGPLEAWDAPPTVNGFKGGDLRGITDHLDYLDDLGVTALYLNPIFASASNHRYHTYDYLKVDPLLGGDEALRELLDEAHRRGLRVVLDGVFNHASRGFWPFHHVLETGGASPYRDWFNLNQEWLAADRQLRAYPHEHVQGAPDPDWGEAHQLGDRSIHELGYQAWWDLPALPKLNVSNPEVREYLLRVAEHWIRFGADGWRLDVPEEIPDPAFWAEFRRRVRNANPETYIVGEIWTLAPDWVGAEGFDAVMNYPLAWRILGFAAGRHLDLSVAAEHGYIRQTLFSQNGRQFADGLAEVAAAYPRETLMAQLNMLDSHDTPRALTLCGGDETSLRLAVLLLMGAPGTPCIYYGDEIGMAGRVDPDCRRAFPWNEAAWNTGLRDFVRDAIRVRRTTAALKDGEAATVAAEGSAVAFARGDGQSMALVAVNAGEEKVELRLSRRLAAGSRPLMEVGPASSWSAREGAGVLTLAPRSGAIWAAVE